MLEIRNLHASVEGNEILHGLDLTVRPGEVHAIMGPNGSGKSTLAQVLAGHPAYAVTAGSVLFEGKDLTELYGHRKPQLAEVSEARPRPQPQPRVAPTPVPFPPPAPPEPIRDEIVVIRGTQKSLEVIGETKSN